MKNRNIILQAAVAATLLSAVGVAQAGTITAVTAANSTYAVEAVGTATPITLAPVVYALGVGRTTTQPFTIIYTLTGTSGAVFNATPPIPVGSGTCPLTGSSLKRGGAGSNQVVYDIVVGPAGCAIADTITLNGAVTGPVIRGATASTGITVQLLDTGETACVDNVGTPATCIVGPSTRATLAQAVGFGVAAGLATPSVDTGTITDVNTAIPLSGFVAEGTGVTANSRDSSTTARALLQITNNVTNVLAPSGAGYTALNTDLVTLTVTDLTGFLGVAAGGLCFDANASAVADGTTNLCETTVAAGTSATTGRSNEVFTVSGNTATLASIKGDSLGFNGVGQTLSYLASGTTSMGTNRTLGIAGSITPTGSGGSAHPFAGNANYWQWSSNGTVLQSTLMQTNPGYFIRIALTNTGTSAANYAASVVAEPGNACTLGPGATGVIPANSLVVIETDTICTAFPAGQGARTAVVFTISAPSANIQGIQQLFNKANGGISNNQMVRPGTN